MQENLPVERLVRKALRAEEPIGRPGIRQLGIPQGAKRLEPGRSGALLPHSPLRTGRDSFPSHGSSTSKVPLIGVPAINNCFTIHTDCQYSRSLRARQLKAVIRFPLFY